jgi:hypothetical protein
MLFWAMAEAVARFKSNFARNRPTLSPKTRFIVYCEGSTTEPGYFNALRRSYRSALIDVEIQPTGAPRTIAEKAVERAKKEGLAKGVKARPKSSFESKDQVWAVFDRDEHESFDIAIELCTRHGVNIGRSNPCFEVWLILHEEEFHRPDDRHQVCRHLRCLCPEYDPHGAKICNWPKLLEHVEIAEQRASQQLSEREREGAPFGRPSTTVGALAEAIRKAAAASTPK